MHKYLCLPMFVRITVLFQFASCDRASLCVTALYERFSDCSHKVPTWRSP